MSSESFLLRRTLPRLAPVFIAGCLAIIGLLGTQYLLAANTANADDLLRANAFEPYLVRDISPGTEGSAPFELTTVANNLFFFVDSDGIVDNGSGFEVWNSDGTEEGTHLAAEVISGKLLEPVDVDGTLFFIQDTPYPFLWKSDGTLTGTMMITEVHSYPSTERFLLTPMSGTLYFCAGNMSTGVEELWKTDGTPTGTVFVEDLNGLYAMTPFQGKLYLLTADALWESDGTPAGTLLVKNLSSSAAMSAVTATAAQPPSTIFMAVAGNLLFFKVCPYSDRCELWRSDGMLTGTIRLGSIYSGLSYYYDPSAITPVDGKVFYPACDATHGCELWSSDGTLTNTVLVEDINPGVTSTTLSKLTAVSDTLYFSACDIAHGCELWQSDGTESGTVLVSDITPGAASSDPSDIVHFNGQAFFVANDGISGRELWTSTGTPSSTVLFRDILTGPVGSQPNELMVISDTLFFRANDGFYGQELWKTDGSLTGTMLVRDIRTRPASSFPSIGAPADSTFVFWADDGIHGRTLWRSDATVISTMPVTAIQQPYLPIFSQFTTFKGAAFFGANGRLWRSDGTPEGTLPIRMFISGIMADPVPYYLTVVNSRLFFAANDSDTGTEVFVSDGTATGTIKIIHLTPDNLVGLGDKLYFTTSYYGSKLWESDGTLSGTQVVTALPSVPYPDTSISSNNLFYMTINSQMWRSDGTSLGTFPVGVQCGYPYDVYATSFTNGLYFTTDQDDCGFALWRTDGSMQGTSKIWTAQPELRGTTQYGIEYLATIGGMVYFTAYDNSYGRELWKSDGTLTGTVRVADLYPGAAGSAPSNLFIAADKLFFAADDGIHGRELWQSDGTSAGTLMIADICSGPCSSSPINLSLWNTPWHSTLFFQADDGVHGAELWALRLAEYERQHYLPLVVKQR